MTVRPATTEDRQRLLDWRNDPATRAMSRTGDPVAPGMHEAWLAAVLSDPTRLLLIGEVGGMPVGTVRFDLGIGGDEAEISVTLAPEARGKGLAAPLLRAALGAFRAEHPVPVVAEIRPANTASRRAFEAAGFVAEGGGADILRYRHDPGRV